MKPSGRRLKLFRNPPKKFFEEEDPAEAPIKGPLLPRPLFYALLAFFGVSLMQGVYAQIGSLNTLRVTGALMSGIAIPSILLMFHYDRVYSYTSEENVFFGVAFSLSFMLGLPCALVGIFA